MSAAVASGTDLEGRNSSRPSSGGSLVMNPLVTSLQGRTSVHSLTTEEPALKKRKIIENEAVEPLGSKASRGDLAAATTIISSGNSSCGSMQLRLKATSSSGNMTEVMARKDKKQITTTDKGIEGRQSSKGEEDSANKPVPESGDNAAAFTATSATLKQSATEKTTPAATVTVASQAKSSLAASSRGSLASQSEEPPEKSTKMMHLRQKYREELEYMLREFEKLERQLLGARKIEESTASRERREKLHSFILHLTETIQQIDRGCELEASGESILPATANQGTTTDGPAAAAATTTSTITATAEAPAEKAEEESVRKLEEHILTNLLPVKVRLKKQLAAQQGAKHNPATMPHRGGHSVPASTTAGSTFADLARRQQEAAKAREELVAAPPVAPDQTQFGKPLVKGSSLTKKLHGPTLGSSQRAHGDGVGAAKTSDEMEKKKYIGGLAVGSAQMESSLDAASNVHKIVIQDPALLRQNQGVKEQDTQGTAPTATARQASVDNAETATVQIDNSGGQSTDGLSEERRRKLRRKKRKKMRSKEQAKAVAAKKREPEQGRKKQKIAKKSHRGPRHVEYMCALCNEVYNSTCDYNPWWALAQHDCPKCRKRQIPRIDIGAPANAIEYHPALLAHAEENGGVAPAERSAPPEITEVIQSNGEFSDEGSLVGSDISSDCGDISTDDDDDDADSLDSDNDGTASLSPADRAEQERFGAEYAGPTLEEREASRLLILMSHASTCPCRHTSKEHRETCRSVKWMMLHVRDCPGTTSTYDVCPFPWCRKVKHLLYHLVSCQEPETCNICSPADLGRNLIYLRSLNDNRMKKYRQSLSDKFCRSAAHPQLKTARAVKALSSEVSEKDGPASSGDRSQKEDVSSVERTVTVSEAFIKDSPSDQDKKASRPPNSGVEAKIIEEPTSEESKPTGHQEPGQSSASDTLEAAPKPIDELVVTNTPRNGENNTQRGVNEMERTATESAKGKFTESSVMGDEASKSSEARDSSNRESTDHQVDSRVTELKSTGEKGSIKIEATVEEGNRSEPVDSTGVAESLVVEEGNKPELREGNVDAKNPVVEEGKKPEPGDATVDTEKPVIEEGNKSEESGGIVEAERAVAEKGIKSESDDGTVEAKPAVVKEGFKSESGDGALEAKKPVLRVKMEEPHGTDTGHSTVVESTNSSKSTTEPVKVQ